jgi:aerobic-type carbon monoxide dehydrogenase small subunit (CoxS/CutS family)
MTDRTVIHLNGAATRAPHPGTRLLDWLRDGAGETGPKEGCATGHCGACTVLLDDRPVLACCTLVHTALGRQVWTSSGLVTTRTGRMVQEKFTEYGALQCGFCGPGMTVASVAWLTHRDAGTPRRADVAAALSGNVCRCGGYAGLIDALVAAAGSAEEVAS